MLLPSDPHYLTWSNNKYDFQGGCDQIAIDNCNLQVQFSTRPRGRYSVITEVGVLFKASGETFTYKLKKGTNHRAGFIVDNKLTAASQVRVRRFRRGYQININAKNLIRISPNNWGIVLQIRGGGGYMFGSVGMCGSWNYGEARFKDNSIFDTSGGYRGTRDSSIALALDWQVPVASSILTDPSGVCDASSQCGKGKAFTCDGDEDTGPIVPDCKETNCDKVEPAERKEACENDIETTGDTSWACKYIDENPLPIITPAPNQFVPAPTPAPVPIPASLCDTNSPAQTNHPCGTDSCLHTCVIRPGEC